jgi:Flp pilus assembly protein TadG
MRIARLLARGNTTEAARVHNQHLADQFAKAKAGAVINLSDLMAAKEEFISHRQKVTRCRRGV